MLSVHVTSLLFSPHFIPPHRDLDSRTQPNSATPQAGAALHGEDAGQPTETTPDWETCESSETAHVVTMVTSRVIHETPFAVITQSGAVSERAQPVVDPSHCVHVMENPTQVDQPTVWESKRPPAQYMAQLVQLNS